MKIKLLIIGKKSFVGSNIYNFLKKKYLIKILDFKEFLKKDNKYINNFTYIINCATNKNYIKLKYKLSNDFDSIIANKIIDSEVKFIFLSTRKVYKPKFNIKENGVLEPQCNYSQNKLITESRIQKILGTRLTILRISNLIGLPVKKVNKKLHYTFIDYFFKNIKKQIIYKNNNVYKDFLSIDKFCEILDKIIINRLYGIYNVSLGKKVFLKRLVGWLNFYNKNSIYYKIIDRKYNKDCFTLNNRKLMRDTKLKNRIIDLKKYSMKISKKYFIG
jgi:dTDP-4-dehydrorhamnose reductase